MDTWTISLIGVVVVVGLIWLISLIRAPGEPPAEALEQDRVFSRKWIEPDLGSMNMGTTNALFQNTSLTESANPLRGLIPEEMDINGNGIHDFVEKTGAFHVIADYNIGNDEKTSFESGHSGFESSFSSGSDD